MGAIKVWMKRDAVGAPVGVDGVLSVIASGVRGAAEQVVLPQPFSFPLDASAATVCAGIPETDGTFYYTVSLVVKGSIYAFKTVEIGSGTVDWADVPVVDPKTFLPLDPTPPSAQEILVEAGAARDDAVVAAGAAVEGAATVATYAEPKGLSEETQAGLRSTIGAALDPYTQSLGQYEFQKLIADFSHSWVDTNTNATPGARVFERLGLRLRMTPVVGRGAAGRTIGDLSNLALSGTMAFVPRDKALHVCICSLNDDTLFDGSAASFRGHALAWDSALSLMTSNAIIAANTAAVVYSAGWTPEVVAAASKTDAQGAIQNATGGTRWKTSTVGAYGKHTHNGDQGVDLVFVARAAGAGVITVKEGATTLGTLDLTATTAQECTAVFKVRGRGAGTHEITWSLTSGSSMTLDSIRIPMPTAGLPPIVVLGEPPVIPKVDDQPSYLADLETYKANLADVVTAYPSAIYLDLNAPGWDTQTMLSADGKHPNDAGAAWIASKIIATLATTPFRTGINVLATTYPSAYVAAANSTVPDSGVDGTGFTPSAPTNLTVGLSTATTVALSVTPPSISGITDYAWQYRIIGAGTWSTFTHAISTTPSITITGLDTAANRYEFRVAAVTSAGVLAYSTVATQPYITAGYASRYKASDLAAAAGTAITAWPDQKAIADFIPTSTANGPTIRDGAFRYIEFDSVNDDLARAMPAGSVTVFLVARVRTLTPGTSQLIMAANAASDHIVGISSAGAFIMNNGAALGSRTADNGWHVFSASFDGLTSALQIDNQAAESGSAGVNATATNLRLARSSAAVFYPVDLAEVLIYPSALSAADRAATAAQLKSTYGI